MMICLPTIPCVTHCSGRLNIQNLWPSISTDTKPFDEGHHEKTYAYLTGMIKGYIARGKQERLLKDRERAVKLSLSSNKTTPALDDADKPAAPVKTKKENEAAASSTGDPPQTS